MKTNDNAKTFQTLFGLYQYTKQYLQAVEEKRDDNEAVLRSLLEKFVNELDRVFEEK